MLSQASDADVQAGCCYVLQDLVLNETESQQRAADRDGPSVVVGAMRAHPDSVDVQDAACGALQNLAFASRRNQLAAAAAGAIEAVVVALTAFPQSKDVAPVSCCRLAASRHDCEHSIWAIGKPFHGFPRAHARERERESTRAEVMGSLAGRVAHHQTLLETTIQPGCTRTQVNVQNFGCGAIWVLATEDAELAARAIRAGADKRAIEAIHRFPGNEAVQDNACGALSYEATQRHHGIETKSKQIGSKHPQTYRK